MSRNAFLTWEKVGKGPRISLVTGLVLSWKCLAWTLETLKASFYPIRIWSVTVRCTPSKGVWAKISILHAYLDPASLRDLILPLYRKGVTFILAEGDHLSHSSSFAGMLTGVAGGHLPDSQSDQQISSVLYY